MNLEKTERHLPDSRSIFEEIEFHNRTPNRLSDQSSASAIMTTVEPDEPELITEKEDNFEDKKYFCTNLKFYVRELTQTIEVHGLCYIFEQGRTLFERLFWIIILLTSLGMCVLLVITIQNMYENTPIIISFSTQSTPVYEIPFPAVTICSQVKAPLREPSFVEIRRNYVNTGKFSSNEDFEYFQYMQFVCDNDFVGKNMFAFKNESLRQLDDSFFETMKAFSPKIDEMMDSCFFLGELKNCSDLFTAVYTKIGVCYSFNMVDWREIFREKAYRLKHSGYFESNIDGDSDWSVENYYKTRNAATYPLRGVMKGPINSLTVYLKQNVRDIDPVCTTGTSGFRIRIHDPLRLPNFEDHSTQVSLNTSMMIAIHPHMLKVSDVVKSLPLSTRRCYLQGERSLEFYKRYNQKNCLSECLHRFILSSCGCVPFYAPREQTTPLCGAAKLHCVLKAKRTFELDLLNEYTSREEDHNQTCNCKKFCAEFDYNVEISVSESDFQQNSDHNLTYEMSHLTIFFKSKNFVALQKVEFYGLTDLLAHIGGLLNFFIGSSVLTFLEIVYAFTLKILCNKIIYGPWAGPAAVQYNYVLK